MGLLQWNQVAANVPLAQQTYSLTVWGDFGPDVPPEPGLLSPNNALKFALYTPQAYTALANGMLHEFIRVCRR